MRVLVARHKQPLNVARAGTLPAALASTMMVAFIALADVDRTFAAIRAGLIERGGEQRATVALSG